MKVLRNKYLIKHVEIKPTFREWLAYQYHKYIKSVYYKLILLTCSKKHIDKKYKVSICAIFKNEALYLKEWIEFHKIVGVEHFYLYNNNSTDNYIEILKPYIEEGIVTFSDFKEDHAQCKCYEKCVDDYKDESNWIGFIDIDEFVVPLKSNNIYDILKPFERNRGAIRIYWKMFGTSGIIQRDNKQLVTEDFHGSWGGGSPIKENVSTILHLI